MEKDSFDIIWDFLAPDEERFANRKDACRRYWSGLSLIKQRQIYATLFWQREQKIEIEENPFFALTHCQPHPFNYNCTDVPFPENTQLFIAKYGDKYGVYSKLDTEAFLMTDLNPFN